jgi:hypothetical protein
VEAGLAPDEIAIGSEGDAALGDDGVQFGEAVEVPVDDRLVDMSPEGFGRLELGRIGREIDEADAVGHGERRGVPAGAVEHENDDPVGSCAGLAGEKCESALEQSLVDAGRRRDESGDVEPFEAVVDAGDRASAARRPDPPKDRLQPDAVLVGCEDLDDRAGMALRFLGDGFGEVFLNASCSSGVAAHACCGRGR